MKILLKLLRNYDCNGPVTPGDPGHILMRHMLNSSQFLKKVMIMSLSLLTILIYHVVVIAEIFLQNIIM